MTTPRQEAARIRLRDAIRDAGGAVKVAANADIPQTHLSSIASGKRGMGKETAAKLRPLLTMSADDWLELLAPLPEPEEPLVDGVAVQA